MHSEYIYPNFVNFMMHKCLFYMVGGHNMKLTPHLPVRYSDSVIRSTTIVLTNQLGDGQEPLVLLNGE